MSTDALDRDGRVVRRMRRIVAVGAIGLGGAAAAAVAAIGADGRAGLAVVLLCTAVAAASAAGYGAVTALRDDLADVPVSRRRITWIIALFVLAAMLPTMLVGIGG